MPNKMLIDATHPEETRVVVVRGNRVEEFDFETAQRKQLRGNIYLAKVTRVEPSLQAAFIEYGGNRHGFLAFSEIHPDYYQIPVADRQALIEDEERAQREAEAESERPRRRSRHRNSRRRSGGERIQSAVVDESGAEQAQHEDAGSPEAAFASSESDHQSFEPPAFEAGGAPEQPSFPHSEVHAAVDMTPPAHAAAEPVAHEESQATEHDAPVSGDHRPDEAGHDHRDHDGHDHDGHDHDGHDHAHAHDDHERHDHDHHHDEEEHNAEPHDGQDSDERHQVGAVAADGDHGDDNSDDTDDESAESEEEQVESVGGDDALEEVQERTFRPRRQYKIQEVIKRRQVMLVQVVKEERGNKGAALTTYLSLAGRYAVLMPNTARGGGISRKITSAQDRTRLKDVVQDLDVPEGMGIILRTAGASRTKIEIKRDFEYLLRLWETVRDLTLKSTAPALVYEEGSLIKRSIRDLYNKDIDEVLVAGEAAHTEAREFMHMLMPGQARAVKLYRDPQPLFSRMGVESQLDAMFSQTVQLRSGGYIVLNQTEALVAIDVNSGRATREHHIEDTALKTNLEAAEEVARQLRLRDLAGLIVIDFIDMDEKRNNRAVERKISECLRHDRARIQVGRISHFGLLEMSRQRIRASVLESSTEPCPHCGGLGHVRSISSAALQLLRGVEEALMKGATHNLTVRTRPDVALYVLNHKRGHLRDLENGFKVSITVVADATMSGPLPYVVERGEMVHTLEAAKANLAAQVSLAPAIVEDEIDDEFAEDESDTESEDEAAGDEAGEASTDETASAESEDVRRKRRRRRRGRGRGGENREPHVDGGSQVQAGVEAASGSTGESFESAEEDDEDASGDSEIAAGEAADGTSGPGGERRPRRRGRRGGRRRRGFEEGSVAAIANDELQPTPPAEVAGAVADLDQPARDHSEPQPYYQQPQVEQPIAPAAPREDADNSQQPRRRSTVREPAPSMTSAPVPEPAPQAVVSESPPSVPAEPASDAPADAPRKAGWWSRRFGGG